MTIFYPLAKRDGRKVTLPAPPLDTVERARWKRLYYAYLYGNWEVEYDYNQKYEVDRRPGVPET